MQRRLRIVAMLLGAGFVLQGVGWLVAPVRSAAALGMPLLDGVGRSTQVGDFAAFFLTAGVTMLAGTRRGHGHLLYVPAGLLGAAAFGRTVAWAFHGAAFAATFIASRLSQACSSSLSPLGRGDRIHSRR
jgi:hypothetical protein